MALRGRSVIHFDNAAKACPMGSDGRRAVSVQCIAEGIVSADDVRWTSTSRQASSRAELELSLCIPPAPWPWDSIADLNERLIHFAACPSVEGLPAEGVRKEGKVLFTLSTKFFPSQSYI